jgi:hypothetical protein
MVYILFFDLFKEMQDGFDNVAEDAIIKMNKSESKIIATTVCDLLITYGWFHFMLTQFAYLGNIISITVDASFFLNSPPFTVYLFPEFSTV